MSCYTTAPVKVNDDYGTPAHVWADIKQYIPNDKTIWEPFYLDGGPVKS